MKKATIIALSALMLSIGAFAQGQGRPDKATMIQERTNRMAEKYGLDETQKAKLLELNKEFFEKMGPGMMGPGMMGPGMMGPGMGPGRGPGNMGRPEQGRDTTKFRKDGKKRERVKARPELDESQKNEMDARMKQMEENRTAYDEALKGILTEDQYSAYKKDQESRQGGPGAGPRGRRW